MDKLSENDADILHKYIYIIWCLENTLKIKYFLKKEIKNKKHHNGKIFDPLCKILLETYFTQRHVMSF